MNSTATRKASARTAPTFASCSDLPYGKFDKCKSCVADELSNEPDREQDQLWQTQTTRA
jgi:hypothetical protein